MYTKIKIIKKLLQKKPQIVLLLQNMYEEFHKFNKLNDQVKKIIKNKITNHKL